MISVNVLLGFSQFFRAIPIMNPLPWFMITNKLACSVNLNIHSQSGVDEVHRTKFGHPLSRPSSVSAIPDIRTAEMGLTVNL